MVKKLLIYCFAFLPLLSFAQPINPWPTTNSWWDILSYNEYNQLFGGRTYHMDGDTLIQGMTYQRISFFYGIGVPEGYAGAVRSDSMNRVYTVPKDSLSEVLLYDFNAQIGDTLHNVLFGLFGGVFGLTDMVVTNKDTIQLQDGPHMRMWLDNPTYGYFGEVIDGIGSRPDFLVPSYQPNVSGYELLVCMTSDSVAVIGSGNCMIASVVNGITAKLNIYPNPVRDLLKIDYETPNLIGGARLFDARGSLLQQWDHLPKEINVSVLPAGMYFLNLAGNDYQHTEKIIRR